MTPRFNPEVNGYWMCDIGRFNYHWIEGDERLEQPLVGGTRRRRRRPGARRSRRSSERVVAGGRTLGAALPRSPRTPRSKSSRSSAGSAARSTCRKPAWRSAGGRASSRSRRTSKFKVPPVDAPNVRGARDLGFPVNATATGEADLSGVPRRRRGRPRGRALRVRSRPRRIDRRRVVGDRGEEVGHVSRCSSSRACC